MENNHLENSTLANLRVGAKGRVVSVSDETTVSRRLLEMGITPGAVVRVVKNAPFGCPIEIRVRNSHLALRRSEANSIIVNLES